MALISCPECKREISDQALSCPHCGLPRGVLPSEVTSRLSDLPPDIAEVVRNHAAPRSADDAIRPPVITPSGIAAASIGPAASRLAQSAIPPPPTDEPKTNPKPLVFGLILIVVLIAAVGFTPIGWPISRSIGPSCTLGLNGATASVEVRGWFSSRICSQFVRLAIGPVGVVPRNSADANRWPPICQLDWRQYRFTVRDGGGLLRLNLHGNAMCQGIAQQLPKG